MSAIDPWAMTWGKLFGSTIYVWYGAVICVVLVLVAGMATDERGPLSTVPLLASGLLAQAFALFFALLLLRGRPRRLRFRVSMIQVLSIAAALPFFIAIQFFSEPTADRSGLHWYGIDIPILHFLVATNLIFATWIVFGCYRLMRLELQCRTGVLGWLAFVVFLPLYLGGLDPRNPIFSVPMNVDGPQKWWMISFLVTISLTYAAAFAEPKGIVAIRRWQHDLARRSYADIQASTPSWIVSGAICLVFALAVIALSLNGDEVAADYGVFVVTVLLFAFRDIALLYALTLDARRRRGHLAALVYLAVLYGLIPALLFGIDMDLLTEAFLPTFGGDAVMSTLPVLVQAVAALALAREKWRSLTRSSLTGSATA